MNFNNLQHWKLHFIHAHVRLVTFWYNKYYVFLATRKAGASFINSNVLYTYIILTISFHSFIDRMKPPTSLFPTKVLNNLCDLHQRHCLINYKYLCSFNMQ